MKNADIIRALPQLKSLKYDLEATKRQLRNLEKQQRQLEHEIDALGKVTEIFEGVALHVDEQTYAHGVNCNVSAVDDSTRRYAEVYPNAHNVSKDWGLKLRVFGQQSGGGSEDWRGTDWGYNDAVLVAKRWVAHGHKATEDFEIMCKLRHKLDPGNRAQKRRRAAFEAAWTAGHRELAAELLVGTAKLTRMKLNALATALITPTVAPYG
jgi:hypothetical protein